MESIYVCPIQIEYHSFLKRDPVVYFFKHQVPFFTIRRYPSISWKQFISSNPPPVRPKEADFMDGFKL